MFPRRSPTPSQGIAPCGGGHYTPCACTADPKNQLHDLGPHTESMASEDEEPAKWWTSPPGTIKLDVTSRADKAPDELRGAWAKWERAVEHHTALIEAGREWLDRPAFDVAVNYDAALEAHVASFVVLHRPPPHLGAIAGDCLHNLRSALDLLAWQLAHRRWGDGGIPEDRFDEVSFPIARPHDTHERFARRKALKHVSADVSKMIIDFQRFGAHEPLLMLGVLSNVDKHRLILIGAATVRLRDTRFAWEPKHLRGSGEFLLDDGDQYDDGTRFGLIRFDTGGHPEAVVTVAEMPPSDLRLTYDGRAHVGMLMLASCAARVHEILTAFEAFV